MRIISQDGTIDIPYENTVLYQDEKEIMCIFGGIYIGRKLAQYHTTEKAEKAMEMLREQYSRLQVVKILASGTCEHMEKSLSKDEFLECNLKYREMNIFQFPKDEDVEV